MWQRLNYLVGLTKPAGYTSFANDEAVIPTSAFIIPPFVKFNLGDMYKDQPCVMTSVSLSIPQEASWELTPDGKTKNEYDFLNKTIVKSDQLVGQYPDMVQVSLSFKLLEKRLPNPCTILIGLGDMLNFAASVKPNVGLSIKSSTGLYIKVRRILIINCVSLLFNS